MDINMPLKKVIEDTKIRQEKVDRFGNPTGETFSRTVPVTTRDDGAIILGLLSQVDWNESSRKKLRKTATKLMKRIRKINIANSENEYEIEFELKEKELELLYDFLIKDTPDDIKYQGASLLETIDEFEDWYDMRQIELKSKDSEDGNN